MAETIRGINVVIGAETTGLSKALGDVNKKSKDIQKELKEVDKLLKLDPKNTELLAQKQKLLSDAVTNTKEKLDRLKAAQEQVNEQFAKGDISEGQYRAFQREIVATEERLKTLQAQLGKTKIDFEAIGQSMQNAGQKMTDAGKSLTTRVTAPIVGLGAAALKAGMDFEAGMSEVKAISGATGNEFEALKEKAKEMGANTKFSATEAADALKYMAMAGWEPQQMLEGLDGVMNLAAASGENLGLVSDIVTDSMTAFGLAANQAGQFADVLAAASSKSNTNVGMLGESFKYVAPVAGALGYSVQDTAVALGLMANAGIKSSQSGTALRSALTNLVKPTKEMQKAMDQLGISVTDSNGQMKSLDALMQDLRKAFGGLNESQKAAYATTIFGKEAMSGMLAIINTSEAEYNKLSGAIYNSSGAAKEMADIMMDNAKGGLIQLKSALEGLAIQLSEILIPVFNKIVASVRKVVDWFAGLDKGTQEIIVKIALLIAAVGPLLVIFGMIVSSVGTIVTTFGSLATAVTAAGGVFGVLTRTVGLVIPAIRALGAALVWLVANPVGAAITAIGLLIAGIAALVGYLKKDSLPAVQSFGDQAQASASKASGSFQKFRAETEGALKDTAKAAGAQGAAIGNNLADGVGKGTKKAKEKASKDMREMVDKMKQEVDRSTSELNKLGDALVTAIKKQYEEAEKAQTKALDERVEEEKKTSEQIIKQYEKEKDEKLKSIDKQTDAEKKASDERLKIYDREYTEKLKLVDEEAYQQIKALQAQIDAIDDQTEAEEKAAREQEYQARIAELNKQLAAAETAEEREKIQKDLNKAIADHERQQLLEQRKNQKDALRDQIDSVKEAQTAKKEQLKQELEAQKEAEKERLQVIQESLKDEKEATKDRYDHLKEQESERLKAVQKTLDDEKTAIKNHYDELKAEENVRAQARKMIIERNNEEIVKLLETYNPKWQDAGQSFADSFANGLNSEKKNIQDAVSAAVDIAPVIDKQVAELDRMQAKLKELESAAKGSGDIGGGGGIGGLALDFNNAAVSAGDFANVLDGTVGPAMNGASEGAKKLSDETIAAFIGLQDRATVALNELYWSGKDVTEEMATNIADTYAAMGNEILSNLETNHAEQIQSLQNFFSSTEELTEEEKNAMLQKLNEKHRDERKEIEDGQRRIFEILSGALNDQRALTQAEYDEINGIQRTFTNAADEIFKGHEIEQKALLERMKTEASVITANQAAEVVKNSKEQKDKAIEAAEEQYKKVTEEIIRQRDELGTITKEQADRLIEEAKRQRDESVKNAEDMHEKVVEEAKKQAKEHIATVDWETGEVLSGWEKFKNQTSHKWNEIKTTMSNAWNDMWENTKRKVGDIKSDAINLFVELKNGLKEKMEEAKQWISDIWTQTTEFFSSIDLKEIGKNAIQGLIDGIGSMASALWDKVKSVASGIGNSIKETLDIHSPSRVTMKLGEYTGEGLALGIKNSISDIKRQAENMAAVASDALAGVTTPDISSIGGSSGGSGTSVINMDGMLRGAIINVQNEAHVKLLAKKLWGMAEQAQRGVGGARR